VNEVSPPRRSGRPLAEPFLATVLHARESVRILVSKRGCELASCLLALDLIREGCRPAVATGYFVRDAKRTPHTWVEVEGRVLDPTQEQFSIPPDAEADPECYVERTRSLTEQAEIETFLNEKLVMQVYDEDRRRLADDVARRHGLLIDSHAILEAHGPFMEQLAAELNSGKLSITPISELSPTGQES
jgi:hypothetical protein